MHVYFCTLKSLMIKTFVVKKSIQKFLQNKFGVYTLPTRRWTEIYSTFVLFNTTITTYSVVTKQNTIS